MPRQFRLRSLFILTAIVAMGCLIGPPIVRQVRAKFKAAEAARIADEQYRLKYPSDGRSRPIRWLDFQ
jgi:hypothetical protein